MTGTCFARNAGIATTEVLGAASVPLTSIANTWFMIPPMTSLSSGIVPLGLKRIASANEGRCIVPLPSRRSVPLVSSHVLISTLSPLIVNAALAALSDALMGSISCDNCSACNATGESARRALRTETRPCPLRDSISAGVLPIEPSTLTRASKRPSTGSSTPRFGFEIVA